jgi:peptidyl-prolyl cis-trans isomerase D
MAVLESIRSRIGILVSIIIGISLLAFILTDFLGQGKSIFRNRESEIAEIGGKSINYKEFEAKTNSLKEVVKFQTQKQNLDDKDIQRANDQAWEQLVDETVMNNEYDELDLQVTNKELIADMVDHPYIKMLFTNQETKMYDKNAFLNFGRTIDSEKDPGKRAYWYYIENQIRREQYLLKYNSLVKNGFNTTSKQIDILVKDNSKKVNFDYVAARLNSISDSAVVIREKDLEEYYKEHSYEFEQKEANREIEYISYDIVPSESDYDQVKKWIYEKKRSSKIRPKSSSLSVCIPTLHSGKNTTNPMNCPIQSENIFFLPKLVQAMDPISKTMLLK